MSINLELEEIRTAFVRCELNKNTLEENCFKNVRFVGQFPIFKKSTRIEHGTRMQFVISLNIRLKTFF